MVFERIILLSCQVSPYERGDRFSLAGNRRRVDQCPLRDEFHPREVAGEEQCFFPVKVRVNVD